MKKNLGILTLFLILFIFNSCDKYVIDGDGVGYSFNFNIETSSGRSNNDFAFNTDAGNIIKFLLKKYEDSIILSKGECEYFEIISLCYNDIENKTHFNFDFSSLEIGESKEFLDGQITLKKLSNESCELKLSENNYYKIYFEIKAKPYKVTKGNDKSIQEFRLWIGSIGSI